MKKFGIVAVCLLLIGLIAGCGQQKKADDVLSVINNAKDTSIEQLIERAKAETGDFTVYSTSSKTDKTVKAFFAKYGLQGTGSGVKQNEKDFYSAIEKLIDGGSAEIDAVVTQNGASLSVELGAGNLINYNPVVPGAAKSDMYAFMYYFKEFAMDKKFDEQITNVWDLIDTSSAVYYRKAGEPINQLFMAALTSDAWAQKLSAAYDEKYGAGTCDSAVAAGGFKNAGYLFINGFLKKATDYESEGKIASKIVVDAEKPVIGFSPVTKYSTGAEGTYNKVKFFNKMKGFNGYAYKFYTQIAKTTDRPYTAMLFINYLSTAEGIATYQEGNGVYSTNNTVQQDIDSLLDGFVLENYTDVKSDWASIVKLLEGYN